MTLGRPEILSREQWLEAHARRLSGERPADIAHDLGVRARGEPLHGDTLTQGFRRRGWAQVRYHALPPWLLAEAIRAVRRGRSLRSVAREHGIDHSWLSRRLRR